MSLRHECVWIGLSVLASLGAGYQTPNFVVEAPTPQFAKQIGDFAEHYRKEKALLWLGQEMPRWPEPCPIQVKVTPTGAGGATSFAFDQGRVLGQQMTIEGTAERLLYSVLPHEVTHTVFAYWFRRPLPRWADEGGAVHSEDDAERRKHDRMCRDFLNAGQAMPLRRLFGLMQYPNNGRDVMVLYAQGFSVTSFLVERSNRQTFLNFLAHALNRNSWDDAAQTYYGFRNVDALEQAWLKHLIDTKPAANTMVAMNSRPPAPTAALGQQVLLRQSFPAFDPQAVPNANPAPTAAYPPPGQPVARGAMPEPAFAPIAASPPLACRPIPVAGPALDAVPNGWTPIPPPVVPPPNVELGMPQFIFPDRP
jgi:hypothetical protein